MKQQKINQKVPGPTQKISAWGESTGVLKNILYEIPTSARGICENICSF